MTDYFPPAPLPGSNAIGQFIIGESPIGTISVFAWQDTVISQYANSPILLDIINNFNTSVNQTADLDQFFDLVWNVNTAQGWGLDVWGRIVGVSRILVVSDVDYLGFEEAGDTSANPFNSAPFYSGADLTDNFYLTDTAYRQLILTKALANICDGSIKAINQLLLALFPGRGNAYVKEESYGEFFGFKESGEVNTRGFNQAPFYSGIETFAIMTMTYVFNFTLTPVEVAIVTQSGVLPHPTGVNVLYEIN